MTTSLTALVPTHGRPTLLARTLRSVAACERPAGYAGCVVVENGPRAGAEAVVAKVATEHPEAQFRYLHHTWANKSAALNAALAEVDRGSLCVFFDDDVRVDPGVLVAYATAAARRPTGAIFGGPFGVDYETEPESWVKSLLPASARGAGERELLEMGYFIGFNWAACAGDLVEAGGFDPNVGPGSPTGARGQESDMQRRLRAVGYDPVFVPSAEVWHYVPKERCSPEWAVERMYASGRGNGSRARMGREKPALQRGLRVVVAQSPRYLAARMVGRFPERMRARAYLAFWHGYLRGYLTRPA